MPDELQGTINITANLTLKDGKYSVTIERDTFIRNINSYVEANIDKIIMKKLGTTSSMALDTLAKLAGYADYADMRQQILDRRLAPRHLEPGHRQRQLDRHIRPRELRHLQSR